MQHFQESKNNTLQSIPDSGIRELFIFGTRNPKRLAVESGILGFGIRNPAQGVWNPTNDWNPLYRFH